MPALLFLLAFAAACLLVVVALHVATRVRVPDHVPAEWTEAWRRGRADP